MIRIQVFTVNPVQENTYVLYNDENKCAIVDPGMYTASEQNQLVNFIRSKGLEPVLFLNTHCHIDHVLGNKFVHDQYGLLPQFHKGELPVLEAMPAYSVQFGLQYEVSPLPDTFLPESGEILLGKDKLQLIFAPGHSPAHLCFYNAESNVLIGGDVLFYRSIGRTDLPGGDHELLLKNIREKLFVLPEDCTVYPGHGRPTTIGEEKLLNPFLS